MKTRSKLLVIVAIVALVLAGRWLRFYRGRYRPPEIAEIDAGVAEVVPPPPHTFEDEPQPGAGRVLIDLSHDNRLDTNDLSPLRDRIAARGATVETFTEGSVTEFRTELRHATALVVIAPTERYTLQEQEAIVVFVEDGGRVFLAADPTRPVPEEDDYLSLYDLFFPTSAVPRMNSLANALDVVYFDDYVYNMEANEGNYRNVRFTQLDDEHPLMQDVSSVVLFAAHSLRGTGRTLVWGDAQTRSSIRTGEIELPMAVLARDEHVLAVGDVTFLTAPYHTWGDNDRFLSHIADWLAEDVRVRDEVADFPYIFADTVSLIQASGEYLAPQLIAGGDELQTYFEEAGRELTLRVNGASNPHPIEGDLFYVGLFADATALDARLASAGITVTMGVEPPGETDDESPEASSSFGGADDEDDDSSEDKDQTEGETIPGVIEIAGLGSVGTEGTALFALDETITQTTLIVLAETQETTEAAVARLVEGDFSDCVTSSELMLCSTGEAQTGLELGEEDEDEREQRIMILADDAGLGDGERTSVEAFEDILSEDYDVEVWSVEESGLPKEEDFEGFDAYIVDRGDYEFNITNTEDSAVEVALDYITSGGLLLIGSQPIPGFEDEYAELQDIEIAETEHPLARDFTAGDIIELSESESGVPAMILTEEVGAEGVDIILKRGPESEEPGSAVMVSAIDADEEISRVIIAAFAFYRLPEEAQRTLAFNAAAWLVAAGE